MKTRLAISTVLILLALASSAAANVGWPLTRQTIYDPNNVLKEHERQRIAAKYDALNEEVGIDMVAVLVSSFDGEDPQMALERLINEWRLGERNEGVGVVVAMDHFEGRLYVVGTDRAQEWLSKSEMRRLEKKGVEYINERRYESAMTEVGERAASEFEPDGSDYYYGPNCGETWFFYVIIALSAFARMAFWGYGGFWGRGWYGRSYSGFGSGMGYYDDGYGHPHGWGPLSRRGSRTGGSYSDNKELRDSRADVPAQDPRYSRGRTSTRRAGDPPASGGAPRSGERPPRPLKPKDDRWNGSGSSSGGW